jgi:lipoprotein NlpI
LEEAVRINPNYAEAFNNLGLALKENGKLEAAIENFHRALEIRPSYLAARQNLEETEHQLKRGRSGR